jgi:hypothetical protein
VQYRRESTDFTDYTERLEDFIKIFYPQIWQIKEKKSVYSAESADKTILKKQ